MVSKVRNVRLGVFSGGGCHHPNTYQAVQEAMSFDPMDPDYCIVFLPENVGFHYFRKLHCAHVIKHESHRNKVNLNSCRIKTKIPTGNLFMNVDL